MTVVSQPTSVGADGEVDQVPDSIKALNEWESYWVELWVNTQGGPGVAGASVDLSAARRILSHAGPDAGRLDKAAGSIQIPIGVRAAGASAANA